MSKQSEAYASQIRSMIYHGNRWLDANIGEVRIKYNFPPDVGVIATIDDAVKRGLITMSPDAAAFVREMTCQTPGATVFMLKCALDLLWKERKFCGK